MYWRFRDSILKPSKIVEYIDNKKKTILYFIIMVLLFILPNLVYIIYIGGISNSEIVAVVDSVSEEKIEYQILDNNLIYTGTNSENSVKVVNSSSISLVFTELASSASDSDFTAQIKALDKDVKNKLSSLLIIFTSDGIVGGVNARNIFSFNELASYEEIATGNLNFNQISELAVQNEFTRIIRSVYEKYKPLIMGISIPALLINGILSLLMMLLFTSFITYFFNRNLQIKFGVILRIAIYAFTPFVLATTISLGDYMSFLSMAGMLVSFVYLMIALSTYNLKKVGGIKNEL